MSYSPEHDTGDLPCEKGACCAPRREDKTAKALLEAFRAAPPEQIQEQNFLASMKGQEGVPSEVYEVMFLLDHAWVNLTLGDICQIVGISYARLMKLRQAHSDLEDVCRLYLAGLAEDEFSTGRRKMAPTVMVNALERLVPAFQKDNSDTLSMEDVTVIVNRIVDGVKAQVNSLDLDPAREQKFLQAISACILDSFMLRMGGDESKR